MTLDANKTLRITYNHHLGNVRATVTDLRQGLWNQGELSSQTSLASAFDYYPFGMIMPGRSFNADKYKFGYQGQEKDDEVNWLHFTFRDYDPRIGRFFTIDPLASKYPYNSTYAFAENKLGLGKELEGLELLKNNTSMFKMEDSGGASDPVSQNVSLVNSNVPKAFKGNLGQTLFTPLGLNMGTNGADINTNGSVFKSSESSINNLPDNPSWQWSPSMDDAYEEPVSNPLSKGLSAVGEGRKWVGMFKAKPIWEAYSVLKFQKSTFYNATNIVDNYINANSNDPVLKGGFMRAALINFVNDGTLSGAMQGNMFNYAKNNAPILKYGLDILRKEGIVIRDATQNNNDFISKMLEIQSIQNNKPLFKPKKD